MLDFKVSYQRKTEGIYMKDEAHAYINGVDVSDNVAELSIDFDGPHPKISMKIMPDTLKFDGSIDEKGISIHTLEILKDYFSLCDEPKEETV